MAGREVTKDAEVDQSRRERPSAVLDYRAVQRLAGGRCSLATVASLLLLVASLGLLVAIIRSAMITARGMVADPRIAILIIVSLASAACALVADRRNVRHMHWRLLDLLCLCGSGLVAAFAGFLLFARLTVGGL